MKLVLLLLTAAGVAAVAFCDGGEASDPNGDTGREVAVRVGGTEDVRLEIDFGLGWENASTMTLMPTELTEVPVFPVEICDEDEAPSITVGHVNGLLREVNEIYEQVGLRFVCVTGMTRVISNRWNKNALANGGICSEMLNRFANTGCLELYFVNGGVPGEALGRGNTKGVAVKKVASGRTLGHEIGHACGLSDIYVQRGGITLEGADLDPAMEKMPADWGLYDLLCSHDDIIKRLLMYGIEGTLGMDIPSGSVFGLVNSVTGGIDAGDVNVGRAGMLVYPPISR